MNWRAKAALQQAFSLVPGGHRLNLLFQRHVTHGLPIPDSKLDERVDIAAHHARILVEHGTVPLADATWFEFGAGWDLATPLLLYSAGAERQIVADIRPLVDASLVVDMARRICGRDLERPFVRTPQVDDCTLGGLLTRHGIDYRAPCDARATGLPSGSVDYITSTNTLEHIPPTDIHAILRECRRLIKPQGLMSFQIDYQDHYSYFDRSITAYNYLRFRDRTWRLYNPSLHFQNRLRHRDHLELIARAGFDIVNAQTFGGTEQDLETIRHLPIADRFRGYEPSELAVRWSRLLLRPRP